LGVPERERAQLSLDMVQSLDEPESDAAHKWTAEIEQRAREPQDVTAKLVDSDQALVHTRTRGLDRRR